MADRSQPLTKRQKRLAEKGTSKISNITTGLPQIDSISPKTENQAITFEHYDLGRNLFLHGCAGTGKTFISIYLALNEILSKKTLRRKLIIVRTAQPTKAIGFLPGTEKQKMEAYEAAYVDICNELFGRGDAYEILKAKGIIEFHGTAFLRGTTKDNAIMLIDECQNQAYQELRTVLTRVGENTRVILCGDTKQDDLTSPRFKEQSGLVDMMKVFNKMEMMESVEFDVDDIVRSGFVRDFIVAENELGLY